MKLVFIYGPPAAENFVSSKDLKEFLQKWDFYSEIPFVKSLRIDNSKISVEKTARMIKSHYIF